MRSDSRCAAGFCPDWRRWLPGVFLCVVVFSHAAQTDAQAIFDLSLDQLADVVVTDAKIAQPHDTLTRRFEAITANEFGLRAAPQRNLAELLRYVSGQFVNPLSRNDANWGAYAGLGPQYNTYLLDGLPIDSFADAMSLDPWAFQAVEMHKSPASVLYANYLTMDFAGNEAPLAGTTNFILRDHIETPVTRLAVGAGSYATYQASAYHQDRRGWLSYFVGGSFERSNYTNYGTPGSWLHMIDPPNYTKTKLYGKFSGVFADGRQELSLFVHQADHRGDLGRPNRDFANDYETINLTYANRLSTAWNLQCKAGFRGYEREWTEDNYPVDLRPRERDGVVQRIFPADVTVTYQREGRELLTFGGDFQAASYRTHQVLNDVTARAYGLFAQEKIIRGRWIWRAGARLNQTHHHYAMIDGQTPENADKSWDTAIWSGGVRFNASSSLAWFGNVGSSFLAPSAKAVCGTLDAAEAGVPGHNGQLPSPGLQPERGTGADVGVDFGANGPCAFVARAFVNRVHDAIVENVVSALPSQTRAVNAGGAVTRGFELSLEMRANARAKWFMNLTRNYSELRHGGDPDQDRAQIPFVPAFVGNAGITLRFPREVSVVPCLQVVGDYYDSGSRSARTKFGSYQLLNVRAQKIVRTHGGYAVSYTVDLNNVFDSRHRMPWQFRETGRNWFFSVGLVF